MTPIIIGLVLPALLFAAVYFPTLNKFSLALVSPHAKADVRKRLAAALIDGAPIVASFLFYWSAGSVMLPLIGAAYLLLRDGVRGQSLGKLWLGLVVVSLETGEPCTLMDSVWRNALFLIQAQTSRRWGSRHLRRCEIRRVSAWVTESRRRRWSRDSV